MKKTIALLVLNYNDFQKTYNCLESCLRQKSDDIIVVLVDNASTDNSLSRIKEIFKDKIEYLLLDKNWGYAGGNNRAVKTYHKRGLKYSFILNNDVILVGDYLVSSLKKVIDNYESCAIVAPTIYNITSRGNVKVLNNSGYLKMLECFGVIKQNKVSCRNNINTINEAHGSAIFVDNSKFLEVNGFPEENFMYGDESVLAKKIINAGYNILQYSSEEYFVEHHHDTTQGVDLWRLFLMGRNKVLETRYFNKDKLYVGRLCLEISLMYTALKMHNRNEKKAFFQGVKKGRKLININASNEKIFEDAKMVLEEYI